LRFSFFASATEEDEWKNEQANGIALEQGQNSILLMIVLTGLTVVSGVYCLKPLYLYFRVVHWGAISFK